MKRKYLRNHLMKGKLEAGCDEAGRGCLAGPVFAAAVILPQGYQNKLLNDSKKIPEPKRDELRMHIEEHAVAFGVGSASQREIDQLNILQASLLAMHRAIDRLAIKPELLLIDGNRFKVYDDLDHRCIIKGDAKFKSIAAASILAKTYRDRYMLKLAQDYEVYDWINNKGYGTASHLAALNRHGHTPHHRLSFTKAFQASSEEDTIHE